MCCDYHWRAYSQRVFRVSAHTASKEEHCLEAHFEDESLYRTCCTLHLPPHPAILARIMQSATKRLIQLSRFAQDASVVSEADVDKNAPQVLPQKYHPCPPGALRRCSYGHQQGLLAALPALTA